MIRLEKRMSLQELANKSEVGKSSIFDAEQEGSNPTVNTLLRLASALEVPVEEFFRDDVSCNEGMSVGERIKELRKEKGITQEELGKHVGVSTSMVGMYETNARKPSYEVLSKIAKYFRVSTDYLLGETDSNIHKETFISISREDFKDLSEFILDESLEENNNISIFTQDGLIKIGIDKVHTEVISEYKGEKVVLNE
ncbi:helix-turn-helix domain-containing protein [Clostridium botulinum]|uniref:helix-turn-helix domain-containing protein n=1 Tax=Clostridium botulinum TaxID=1491 RepID=UPI003DA2929E